MLTFLQEITHSAISNKHKTQLHFLL